MKTTPTSILTAFLALSLPVISVPCGDENNNPGHGGDNPGHGHGQNNGKCTSTSATSNSWTVHDLTYHASYIFSTPSHQIPSGRVNFTLSNPALDYNAYCEARSSRLTNFFYGDLVYDCTLPSSSEEGDMASFTYNKPKGLLTLNQTWYCPDKKNGKGWHATGDVTVDLDCETERWKNPDWEIGEIYRTRTVTCMPVTVEVEMEEKSHGGN